MTTDVMSSVVGGTDEADTTDVTTLVDEGSTVVVESGGLVDAASDDTMADDEVEASTTAEEVVSIGAWELDRDVVVTANSHVSNMPLVVKGGEPGETYWSS